MLHTLNSANVLLFTGGMPDKALERLREKHIFNFIHDFKGVVFGYSAGAIMQMKENFISPDDDYPQLLFMNGLGLVDNNFFIEVHYEANEIQMELLQSIADEKCKIIYAISNNGAIIVDETNDVKLYGDVTVFYPTKRA